jgi:hypothetical protein
LSRNKIGQLITVASEPTGEISGQYRHGTISSTQAEDGAVAIILRSPDGKQKGAGTLNALQGTIKLPTMGGNFSFTFDPSNDTLTFSDGDKWKKEGESSSAGAIAIANAISNMRALTKLDISRNFIGAEQEGGLQRLCVAGGIELAK